MFARALLAFLILPGVVAGLVPILILSAWSHPERPAAAGETLMAVGTALLLWCVRDFYVRGRGSLAPWAPPTRLVVTGLYRYVRNPMYLSVVALVAGWAVAFSSGAMAIYLAILAAGFHLRVRFGEEPGLRVRFGAEWDSYSRQVPRWIPRLKAWSPRTQPGPSDRGDN